MLYVGLVLGAVPGGVGPAAPIRGSTAIARAAAALGGAVTPSRSTSFGFFAVALLSGSLADSLQSAGARLEQASDEIADLQALNQHVIDSLPSGLATTDHVAARS